MSNSEKIKIKDNEFRYDLDPDFVFNYNSEHVKYLYTNKHNEHESFETIHANKLIENKELKISSVLKCRTQAKLPILVIIATDMLDINYIFCYHVVEKQLVQATSKTQLEYKISQAKLTQDPFEVAFMGTQMSDSETCYALVIGTVSGAASLILLKIDELVFGAKVMSIEPMVSDTTETELGAVTAIDIEHPSNGDKRMGHGDPQVAIGYSLGAVFIYRFRANVYVSKASRFRAPVDLSEYTEYPKYPITSISCTRSYNSLSMTVAFVQEKPADASKFFFAHTYVKIVDVNSNLTHRQRKIITQEESASSVVGAKLLNTSLLTAQLDSIIQLSIIYENYHTFGVNMWHICPGKVRDVLHINLEKNTLCEMLSPHTKLRTDDIIEFYKMNPQKLIQRLLQHESEPGVTTGGRKRRLDDEEETGSTTKVEGKKRGRPRKIVMEEVETQNSPTASVSGPMGDILMNDGASNTTEQNEERTTEETAEESNVNSTEQNVNDPTEETTTEKLNDAAEQNVGDLTEVVGSPIKKEVKKRGRPRKIVPIPVTENESPIIESNTKYSSDDVQPLEDNPSNSGLQNDVTEENDLDETTFDDSIDLDEPTLVEDTDLDKPILAESTILDEPTLDESTDLDKPTHVEQTDLEESMLVESTEIEVQSKTTELIETTTEVVTTIPQHNSQPEMNTESLINALTEPIDSNEAPLEANAESLLNALIEPINKNTETVSANPEESTSPLFEDLLKAAENAPLLLEEELNKLQSIIDSSIGVNTNNVPRELSKTNNSDTLPQAETSCEIREANESNEIDDDYVIVDNKEIPADSDTVQSDTLDQGTDAHNSTTAEEPAKKTFIVDDKNDDRLDDSQYAEINEKDDSPKNEKVDESIEESRDQFNNQSKKAVEEEIDESFYKEVNKELDKQIDQELEKELDEELKDEQTNDMPYADEEEEIEEYFYQEVNKELDKKIDEELEDELDNELNEISYEDVEEDLEKEIDEDLQQEINEYIENELEEEVAEDIEQWTEDKDNERELGNEDFINDNFVQEVYEDDEQETYDDVEQETYDDVEQETSDDVEQETYADVEQEIDEEKEFVDDVEQAADERVEEEIDNELENDFDEQMDYGDDSYSAGDQEIYIPEDINTPTSHDNEKEQHIATPYDQDSIMTDSMSEVSSLHQSFIPAGNSPYQDTPHFSPMHTVDYVPVMQQDLSRLSQQDMEVNTDHVMEESKPEITPEMQRELDIEENKLLAQQELSKLLYEVIGDENIEHFMNGPLISQEKLDDIGSTCWFDPNPYMKMLLLRYCNKHQLKKEVVSLCRVMSNAELAKQDRIEYKNIYRSHLTDFPSYNQGEVINIFHKECRQELLLREMNYYRSNNFTSDTNQNQKMNKKTYLQYYTFGINS